MRHVTFRKVYGYRDLHNGVQEIGVPENDGFYCVMNPVREVVMRSRRVHYQLNLDELLACMFDIARLRQEEVRMALDENPQMPPQPMQDRIDAAFGLTAAGEQQQLQNILDKVKKHL